MPSCFSGDYASPCSVLDTSNSFSQHHSTSKGVIAFSPANVQDMNTDATSESMSSRSGSPLASHFTLSHSESSRSNWHTDSMDYDYPSTSVSPSRGTNSGGLRRSIFRSTRMEYDRTQAILVVGPPGCVHQPGVVVRRLIRKQHRQEFHHSRQSSEVERRAFCFRGTLISPN